MAEQISHVRLKLTGEMTCAFQGMLLTLEGATLKVLFEAERQPYHVELHLALTRAEEVSALAAFFPGLTGLHERPPFHFGFSMKPESLSRYAADFAAVGTLEDWVTVANGACFELSHYTYIGRVDF